MGIPDTARASTSFLRPLGIFSFDKVEFVLLASLVTEDPLLLIGASGTGKTFLLNSLSEALGLEHRHYNASLISFDDLVGFPYPDPEGAGVKFLETPATVWGAESVLVDEISRCKPEHQNRLFSLVHERRVQGIRLDRLRFRWAAMNPCSSDQDSDGGYAGSEPLDPALADRFALVVQAADWLEMDKEDQRRVADPAGEGLLAADGGRLREALQGWRMEFLRRVEACPEAVLAYATAATTFLNTQGTRISPRRSRFLTRSLLATEIVADRRDEDLYRSILAASLPHATWGSPVKPGLAEAAHRAAWDSSFLTGVRKWIHDFHLEPLLAGKARLLLKESPGPDAATQAIAEFLAREPKERKAAFSMAMYPAALAGAGAIGGEGVNDLGKVALAVLSVEGEISWQERRSEQNTQHPEFVRYAKVLNGLNGARKERAKQLFSWCLVNKTEVPDPSALEQDLEACIQVVKPLLPRRASRP